MDLFSTEGVAKGVWLLEPNADSSVVDSAWLLRHLVSFARFDVFAVFDVEADAGGSVWLGNW